MDPPTETQVLEQLRRIVDPDLHRDIVSLGFVKNIQIRDGVVAFDIELTTPACPVKDRMESAAREYVGSLPGVKAVQVRMTSNVRGREAPNVGENLRQVQHIIAIASGKGGVGKSTATINLAVALAKAGAKVGVLDADVYGPSIPRMVGLADGASSRLQLGTRLLPETRFNVKLMSMGLLANKETPVVWRGPMASKLIQQFLGTVAWGPLDYLLVDLPPGTGDIQLTLAQSVPLTGVVVLTTPQDVAANVAERGARMFAPLNIPILGVVENMSGYECPECGHMARIFQEGGGERAAQLLGAPFFGRIPLEEGVAASGDAGVPIVERAPDAPAARAYQELAKHVASQVSIVSYATQQAEKAHPLEYEAVEGGRLAVKWSDGHGGQHTLRRLRAACPCAHCVDEWTGQRRVHIEDVQADVEIEGADSIGRYATRFRWSDGHSTGIYTFARLRDLCECPDCAARGAQTVPPALA